MMINMLTMMTKIKTKTKMRKDLSIVSTVSVMMTTITTLKRRMKMNTIPMMMKITMMTRTLITISLKSQLRDLQNHLRNHLTQLRRSQVNHADLIQTQRVLILHRRKVRDHSQLSLPLARKRKVRKQDMIKKMTVNWTSTFHQNSNSLTILPTYSQRTTSSLIRVKEDKVVKSHPFLT